MKQISSHTTFLYQLVWPVFFGFFIFVIIKLMFTFQFMIGIGIIYILVYVWIFPIFVKLKNVWWDKDNNCLLTTDSRGNKNIIQKKYITDVSQNAFMITPRIVKVTYESDSPEQQSFRFIPSGGYWMFWEHGIVKELNNWRLKDSALQ